MNRVSVALLVVGLGSVLGYCATTSAASARLENSRMQVQIDDSGAVTSLVDKVSQIKLSVLPGAVQVFSLRLGIQEDSPLVLSATEQVPPLITVADDTCRVTWPGPLVNPQGDSYDIKVVVTYTLRDTALAVSVAVVNRSAMVVREVRYPQIGGLTRLRPDGDEEPVQIAPLSRNIPLTLPFTEQEMRYPSWPMNMGFLTASHEKTQRGFYMGAHDEIARMKAWRFEEVGPADARDIAGQLIHYPFIQPGQSFQGCAWMLAFFEGDWTDGGQIYREWFLDAFGVRDRRDDWIREKNCYQMIMMMLPEGNINYRFADVPDLAREGLKYGVDSLQLAGWQRGGHDNGYPYYEPDPRLGSWDDVERAIRECHELGVRVYFFGNIHCAMLDLDWYKDELHRYAALNAKGQITWIGHWGMGTVGSRLAYTVPRMAFLDASFPGIADPTVAYFKRLAALGADGIHIDKLFPNALEYNPNIAELGVSPDVSPWQGTLDVVARIDRECRAINPEFAISFECVWDRVISYGTATWWAGNMSRVRRIFPEITETEGHYWPFDFFGINKALREGWVVMISPHRFNRGMEFRPWRRMSEYIAETKRIRDRYTDIIFLGERRFGDVIAFGEDAPLAEGVEYAVWRDPRGDREAVILTNTGGQDALVKISAIKHRQAGPVRIVRPFREDVVGMLPLTVAVPSEQYALIVESPEDLQLAQENKTADPLVTGSAVVEALKQDKDCLAGAGTDPLAALDASRHIRLENDLYLVMVDTEHGAIRRILDKQGKLDLILEPRLGNNYTFALPIVGREAWTNTEANYIKGAQQILTRHSLSDNVLKLHWDGPLTSVLGVYYDAAVELTIALENEQITFNLLIDNRTNLEIGEVYYPIIGGTMGLGDTVSQRRQTLRTVPCGQEADSQPIYHNFINQTYFGELYPEQVLMYPYRLSMPWMHLYAPERKRGVYFGAHDPVKRVKAVQLLHEPGIASNRHDGNWPRPEELDGMPAGVSMNFLHMAYHPAGEKFAATPVVLRFHDGDAADAAAYYAEWFSAQYAGQQGPTTHLSAYKIERLPFAEVADQAQGALDAGKEALILMDWKTGGQSNGVPDFRPDPDLGGPVALAAAVKACQARGLRVFLRFNLQLADPETQFFKDNLAGFVCTDRWGIPFSAPVTRWVCLNPGASGLREYLSQQAAELARLGVDGLFIKDFFNHKIDFNPVEGMTADRKDWDGGLQTIEAILKSGQAVQPGFALVTDFVRDHMTVMTQSICEDITADSPFGRAFAGWVSPQPVSKAGQP
ncbi:MAG: hypothetical protein GXY44_05390 [Phycisphaerales bacterium]|nr:hypothetical protein [Phycisphaerales bacterium]